MHDKLSKIMEIKSRFDHFNVNVTDLDRSLKFYAEALGLKEIGRKQAADGSFVLVYLGDSGSVGFLFEHKCVFKFRPAAGADPEELELEMIDLGVDEFYPEEDGITVYAPYESFGAIQKWLDDKGFEIVSGESVRIPTDTKELDAEGRESVEKLVEKLEEDDDVVNVYHTMKEPEEE